MLVVLQIMDYRTYTALYTLRGSVGARTLYTNTDRVQLYFYTDSSVTYPGFLIGYTQVAAG